MAGMPSFGRATKSTLWDATSVHLHPSLMMKLYDFLLHIVVCLLGVSNDTEHEIVTIYLLFLFPVLRRTVRVDLLFLTSFSDRISPPLPQSNEAVS